MNGDVDDDDDDPFDDSKKAPAPPYSETKQQPTTPAAPSPLRQIPLAAPQPGYAAPVSALNLSRPSPTASPVGRQPSPQMSQVKGPKPLTLVSNLNANGGQISPRLPPSPIGVPSTPHPLPPTMTPIMPVFARPAKPARNSVKFAASVPILRGTTEETLLPKRGERGDDFWRRFSMVVKQENTTPPAQKLRYVNPNSI